VSPALFAAMVAATIFVGLFALGAVAALVLRSRGSSRMQRRLTPVLGAGDEFAAQADRPLLQSMARGGKKIETMVDAGNESARLLVQAGWRSSEARLAWYVFQTILPVLLCAAVLAFMVFGPEKNKALYGFAYLFAAVALSFLLPRWVLRSFARRRQRRIKNEVPLFIHLLVLLFEAGLSTRQAIASLVREGRGVLPELGREFELVLRQLEAGGDTAEVLKALSEVLEVDDLTGVLGVLRQVDRYGGEVREPLIEALAVLEERRGLDMREKVNLMSGRMTVVMVLFFFPALLIFVAGPAFLSILRALADVNAR
jgi:tight adherence protein C